MFILKTIESIQEMLSKGHVTENLTLLYVCVKLDITVEQMRYYKAVIGSPITIRAFILKPNQLSGIFSCNEL